MSDSNLHKRILLFILPVILLLSCAFVFGEAANLFGSKMGYFLGFLFYWLFWCFFVSAKLIGIQPVLELFAYKKVSITSSIILCLFIPLVFVYSYAFPSAIKQANFEFTILSLILSAVNATYEEVLCEVYILRSSSDKNF
jgi:hypothetical protein